MNTEIVKIKKYEKPIRTKKLSYKGLTQEFNVYRVPINLLYYNDENGRIATYMSQFISENDRKLEEFSREEYNNIISDFIIESNGKNSFNKTKNDIKAKGQLEAGVILDDGRVIDGNRRYTCLRELYYETKDNKYFYFECVILDSPKTENDRRELRTLELNLQFGVDEKVNYEPIDRLVSIYKDLIGPKKIYKPEEYSKKFNITKTELNKLITRAEIMIDYLEFIGKPMMFHIARDYKLDGPIHELVTLKNKIDEVEWNRIKMMFYYLFDSPGDRTRKVRDLVKSYNKNVKSFNEILEETMFAEEERILNKLIEKNSENETVAIVKEEEKKIVSLSKTNNDILNEDNVKPLSKDLDKKTESENLKLTPKIDEAISELNYETKIKEARKKPLNFAKQSLKALEKVDIEVLSHLDEKVKKEFFLVLDDISEKVDRFRTKLK